MDESWDAGPLDAGTPDAGTPDGGTPDGGTPDGGTPDGGMPDAGGLDAGSPLDGGSPDAATSGPLGSYRLIFVCTANCTGTWEHRLHVTLWNPATGELAGNGTGLVDGATWIMTGHIVGTGITMDIVYTVINPGYQAHLTGETNAYGEPDRGTASSSPNQSSAWTAARVP